MRLSLRGCDGAWGFSADPWSPHAGRPASPLSVTLFSSARVWGGAEEQTRLLAEGLRQAGHTCRFVVRRDGPVARRMKEAGFPTLALPGTGRDPVSLWRTRRHLRATHPDVVHFVDPHAVTVGGLASWRMNIPARISVRHNPFPLRQPARYRWMCDRIICVCRAIAAVCCRCGLPGSMLRVVSNGCLPSTEPQESRSRLRARLGLSDDALVLLNAAHMNGCKGQGYLLESLPAVIRVHPQARLVLIGTGPLEVELRQQARRLCIVSHVDFLGFRSDVRQWMRAADLFVLPSLVEGMPAVLLEAMLEGCPIVATHVGGTPELLRCGDVLAETARDVPALPKRSKWMSLCHRLLPSGQASEASSSFAVPAASAARDPASRRSSPLLGDSGLPNDPLAWVVPPADAAALAATLLTALADGRARSDRAQRARQVAASDYAVDAMVARTLAVYREVIEEHASGRRRSAD